MATLQQIAQLLFVTSALLLMPYALSIHNGLLPEARGCFLGRWSFAISWSLTLLAVTYILYLLKMTGIKLISRMVSPPLGYLIGLGLSVHTVLVIAQVVESTSGRHSTRIPELLKFLLRRPSLRLLTSMVKACGGAGLGLLRSNFAYTLPLASLLTVWYQVSARPSYILCLGAWAWYNAITLLCLVQDGKIPHTALDRAPSICLVMMSCIMLCGMLLITATLAHIETRRRICRIRSYVAKNK